MYFLYFYHVCFYSFMCSYHVSSIHLCMTIIYSLIIYVFNIHSAIHLYILLFIVLFIYTYFTIYLYVFYYSLIRILLFAYVFTIHYFTIHYLLFTIYHLPFTIYHLLLTIYYSHTYLFTYLDENSYVNYTYTKSIPCGV